MAFIVRMRLMWKGQEIRSEKDRPEGVSIRVWRDVAKTSFRAMAYHWHEHMLPLHFGSAARRKYGGGVYKERTTKWIARKLKISYTEVRNAANIKAGESNDDRQRKMQVARQQIVSARGGANYNIDTGTLRQAVKNVIVRAFPGRFRLEMPVPSYIPGRRRSDLDPDIRAELTSVLPSEVEELQKIGHRVLTETMRQVLETGRMPAGAK